MLTSLAFWLNIYYSELRRLYCYVFRGGSAARLVTRELTTWDTDCVLPNPFVTNNSFQSTECQCSAVYSA